MNILWIRNLHSFVLNWICLCIRLTKKQKTFLKKKTWKHLFVEINLRKIKVFFNSCTAVKIALREGGHNQHEAFLCTSTLRPNRFCVMYYEGLIRVRKTIWIQCIAHKYDELYFAARKESGSARRCRHHSNVYFDMPCWIRPSERSLPSVQCLYYSNLYYV